MRKWSLPMVSGKTAMKLKHTLKDAISASEASWHLFFFRMHDRTSSIICFTMHELGMHTVMYNDNASIFETLIVSKTRKQCSSNTSKPILITLWPEK